MSKDIKVHHTADMTPAGTLTGAFITEAVMPVRESGTGKELDKVTVTLGISDTAMTPEALAALTDTAERFSLEHVPSLSRLPPRVRILFDGRSLGTGFNQASPDRNDVRAVRREAAACVGQAITDFTCR